MISGVWFGNIMFLEFILIEWVCFNVCWINREVVELIKFGVLWCFVI